METGLSRAMPEGRRCHAVRGLALLRRLFALSMCLLVAIAAAHAEGDATVLELDPAAESVDLTAFVEFLVDPEHRVTATEARSRRFEPFAAATGDINFGYSLAAHWLRIRLRLGDEPGATAVHRLLEIGYPSLDSVEFYVDDRADPLRAGDRLAFAERVVPHRNFVFPVELVPGRTTVLTLRVASEGSLTMPLTLWMPDAFERHNQGLYIVLGIYFGSLVAMLLYNLLLYFSVHQRSYLEYVGMLAGMIIGQVSLYGFGNQFLWPGGGLWGHVAIVVGFALSGMCSAMFARSFLDTRRNTPRLDRLLAAFVLLFGLIALGVFFLPYSHFAIILTASGIVFAAVAIASSLICMHGRAPGAGLYLMAWTSVLLGAALLGARHHAFIPTNAVTSYAMLVGSALQMLLLSFALADRINSMRRERTMAQQAALQANRKLVETLHQSEHVLELRVSERTRELEIANRQLEENERRLRYAAHHDSLTGLANRALLDDRITQGIVRAQRHHSRMALLLADLDAFKPVNDTYGHAVGDALLVEIGQRLKRVVRAGDTVARLGGDEFVILLEDLFDESHIKRVIAAVVEVFARPYRISERELHVDAAIGCAVFPRDGDSPAALIKSADSAMYRRKEAHRREDGREPREIAAEVEAIIHLIDERPVGDELPALQAAARL